MLTSDIIDLDEMAEARQRYEQANMDFPAAVKARLSMLPKQAQHQSREQVAKTIATMLINALDKELADKPPKTIAGRVIRFLLSIFSTR